MFPPLPAKISMWVKGDQMPFTMEKLSGGRMTKWKGRVASVAPFAVALSVAVSISSSAFADCTPAAVTADGQSVTCTGTSTLTDRYNIGYDDVTVSIVDGATVNHSVKPNQATFSFDVFRSGQLWGSAENISFENAGELLVTRTANTNGSFGAVWMGFGDENNPTNGNMTISNDGRIWVDAQGGWNLPVTMWSPTGTALVKNGADGEILATSTNNQITVYLLQRGDVVNEGSIHAETVDTGSAGQSWGVFFAGDAGWKNGSGYAPNHKSTEFTEDRLFTLNNSGSVTVSQLEGGFGGAVGVSYAQGMNLENSGTLSYETRSDAAHGRNQGTIVILSYGPSDADLRAPLSDFIVRNTGDIINKNFTFGGPSAAAVTVVGQTTDGVYEDTTDNLGFNIAVDLTNDADGKITGDIMLGDADDTVILTGQSILSASEMRLRHGSDTLSIEQGATLEFNTTLDGGDDLSTSDGFIDEFSIKDGANFAATGANVLNWERVIVDGGHCPSRMTC